MRCSRCGNDNPGDNRFCGMCGATLLAPPPSAPVKVPETATQRAASGGADIPAPPVATAARPPEPPPPPRPVETPRPPAPAHDDTPVISGPSFLGLNDPPPRKRASLSADPHHDSSSGNLDYLLDDEEEHNHGRSSGMYILILIALALALGFGYLRWKNGGFAWLNPSTHKPAATQTPTDTNAPPGDTASSPANTPEGQNPANTPAITPVESAPANPAPANPASPSSTVPSNNAASNTSSANPPANNNAAPADTAKPGDSGQSAASAPKDSTDQSASNSNSDNNDEGAAPPKPAEKPKPAANLAPEKPAAAIKPPKPVDTVAEAQRYLYGKGVPQNCDRGLRLLKPSANESNPKAMIEMGALYSAGLCTPRDLPTAYRWFAMALRKDPNNQAVQTDLQKLWGEMTQPERQLAIRLTQ